MELRKSHVRYIKRPLPKHVGRLIRIQLKGRVIAATVNAVRGSFFKSNKHPGTRKRYQKKHKP